ncbi:ABC transporter substrate-binding protein [Allobaculum stercoricanis]|uniref:ABC transporter substrate-binding protein n=1 Tax=Allobaculum stercoricanis TaxID=174709 RepID=UPI00037F801C|nr:extracellular solute-binding protein [Allobaculum stercoricanis]
MKKILNSYKMFIFFLCACLCLGICYGGISKPCVLRLGIFAGSNWDVPGSNVYEIINDAIARFEKENPQIDVVYESGIRKEDYSNWLCGKVLKGEMPDVFMVLDNEFPTLANIQALHPLDHFTQGANGIDVNQFYQATYNAGKWNNTLYALPYESNLQFMFVNLTLLKNEGIEVPDENWTLSDLYRICEQVTKDTNSDGRNDQFGIYNYDWQNSMLAFQERLFEADGSKTRLQEKSVSEAIKYAFQLDELREDTTITQNDFDQGRVAFSPMSYAEYKTYKPYPWKIKKFSRFDWTIIPMPAKNAGEISSATDSLLMSMSSTTNHPQESWELLKTLCYDVQTREMLKEYSQGFPATKPFVDSTMDKTFDDQLDPKLLETVLTRSKPLVRFPNYENMLTLADNQIRSGYQNAKDKDLFMIELQKTMDDALKSNQ